VAKKNVALRLEVQIKKEKMKDFIGWTMVTVGAILAILILTIVMGDDND
jgi:hypothetical protein